MELNLSQLDEHSESETLELKESFDTKTLETIGAFANAKGGTILVGVGNDGHVTGITIGKTTLEEWAQKMQSKIQPRVLPSMTKQMHNNRTIAVIEVERSFTPIAIEGRYFKRVGRTNQLMSSEEYRQRLLSSGSLSWDGAVEERSSIADLDKRAIVTLIAGLKKARRRTIPANEDPIAVLEKLHLLQQGEPTRAAILLLGKDPRQFYHSAYIKAGRLKSPTMIIDDKEFYGNILQQVDKAMDWFQDRLETKFIIGKSKYSGEHKLSGRALVEREEVWQYPLNALREGVVNAVCHRNYTSLAATTIRLYDNRLEIWNPGRLPIQLNPEDLLHEHNSYPPNRLIAETFYNLGIIERWGSGTLRIANLLKEQGLPLPEFDVSSSIDTFKVIMYGGISKREREEPALELNDRQLKAVEYLRSNRSLSAAEYQKLFDASRATATRDLTELARKEVVVQTGRGKGVAYRLADL